VACPSHDQTPDAADPLAESASGVPVPVPPERVRGGSPKGKALVAGAGKRVPRTGARPVPPLVLDVVAVADVEGLAAEIALLRASIRALVKPGNDTAEHVKVLAELRHQIAALCTALKTQRTLAGPEGQTIAAEYVRVLDELGDDLGVPR
jgi:hypothetical protein